MILPKPVKEFFFPVLLSFICLIVIVANWSPGTFLSGWDTLHPEFNFPLAFTRVLNGVWRTDQGLGTIAIQSHMVELPRLIILWLLSHVVSLTALRYITMLTPLLIGPLGMYVLVRSFLSQSAHRNMVAFFGAFAYLANMGTVQHFVVPLEMFAIHYAYLPWIMYTAIQFLEYGKRKALGFFLIITLLMIPQAHTATLFYTFFGGFVLMILSIIVFERKHHMTMRGIVLIVLTLFLNSYWLLPNLFAARTQATEVRNSKINRLFTPEAFAKNQLYGNPFDAALLKNFLFEWQLYDYSAQHMTDVVGPWKDHLKNPLVAGFGYSVFFIAIAGIISVILKKQKHAIILIPLTTVAYLMLLNGTWPITVFFDSLGLISNTLKEALRFPFTKFSILYMLGLSIYFSYGIDLIIHHLKRIYVPALVMGIVLFAGFTYYFLPGFRGNVVSPEMRISIPKEYFDMFEWFNTQPVTDRVAILPIHSFWGWVYYSWGYQGAGFLQFGIPQPILDRDHDRWSFFNEQYEREMMYAVYSNKPELLRGVLEKYNVTWILFDTSVMNLGGNRNATLTWYLPTLLEQSGMVEKAQQFGENLTIYKVKNAHTSPVVTYTTLPDIGPTMAGALVDRVFKEKGPYKTRDSYDFDSDRVNYTADEQYIGPSDGAVIKEITATSPLPDLTPCGDPSTTISRTVGNGVIRYESMNGSLCDHFPLPDLSHDKAYEIAFRTRNIQGFSLEVYICNNLSQHCGQIFHLHKSEDVKTESYIIPAYNDFGSGHTLNINNFSIRNLTSINEIENITIREYTEKPLELIQPRGELSGEGTIRSAYPARTLTTPPTVNPDKENTLVYFERFDPGWKAYEVSCGLSVVSCELQKMVPFLFFKPLNRHVIVNNWANGWELEKPENTNSPSPLLIFYLPQVLEWAGLLLCIPALLFLIKKQW